MLRSHTSPCNRPAQPSLRAASAVEGGDGDGDGDGDGGSFVWGRGSPAGPLTAGPHPPAETTLRQTRVRHDMPQEDSDFTMTPARICVITPPRRPPPSSHPCQHSVGNRLSRQHPRTLAVDVCPRRRSVVIGDATDDCCRGSGSPWISAARLKSQLAVVLESAALATAAVLASAAAQSASVAAPGIGENGGGGESGGG